MLNRYRVQYIDIVIVEAVNKKDAIDKGCGGVIGVDVKKKIIVELLKCKK